MIKYFTLVILSSVSLFGQEIKPILPLPSAKQLAWQSLEYYGFVHFNMNTFTDAEWGEGKENPNTFNPTALNCEQWARIAKKAGMKGLILTAKHHDGFALYPSKYTKHSVANSTWKNGKGDVVRDLANACKKYGLKLGIYLSPWDRYHPDYGTDAYNQVYANMQKELLTQYGPIFEFWYDGANGEGPNGKKQVYDWPLFHSMVEKYQPQAVQFSDSGPDIRWVGNERGYAYDKTWSPINRDEIYPGYPKFDAYQNGQENGSHWVAPEVDVSIRPGWYYHENQDNKVKTPDSLMKIYVASVGRNSNLLLNIPVDRRGLIHENDSASMMGFAAIRKIGLQNLLPTSTPIISSTAVNGHLSQMINHPIKGAYWAAKATDASPNLSLSLKQPILMNALVLQEPIAMGQRIRKFHVEITNTLGETERIDLQTIGNKRIIPFKQRKVSAIKITFDESRGQVLISNLELLNLISTRSEPLYR